jgi:hypothetical protein
MRSNREQDNDPVALVAKSRRDMVDAVRLALSGAARTLGGLERCDATMRPRVVSDGRDKHFEILLSVSRRVSGETAS